MRGNQTRALSSLAILLALALILARSAHAAWRIALNPASSSEAEATSTPAPANVKAACAIGATVKVTWTAVSHAASYTIWQSTTSATSGFTSVASGVTGTSWTSSSLGKGTYWFEVSARIGSNWNGPTSTASAQRTISANGSCT
jgi:hypothetical protein